MKIAVTLLSALFGALMAFLGVKLTHNRIDLSLKKNGEQVSESVDSETGTSEKSETKSTESETQAADLVPVPDKYKSNIIPFIIVVFAAICAFIGYYCFNKVTSPVAIGQLIFIVGLAGAAAVVDFKLNVIPNIIPLLLLGGGLIAAIIKLFFSLTDNTAFEFAVNWLIFNFASALGLLLLLLIVSKVAHGGLGFGDIKLISAVCFAGGLRASFSSLFFAIIICSLFAAVGLVLRKKKFSDSYPFGPFFYIGLVISSIIGIV